MNGLREIARHALALGPARSGGGLRWSPEHRGFLLTAPAGILRIGLDGRLAVFSPTRVSAADTRGKDLSVPRVSVSGMTMHLVRTVDGSERRLATRRVPSTLAGEAIVVRVVDHRRRRLLVGTNMGRFGALEVGEESLGPPMWWCELPPPVRSAALCSRSGRVYAGGMGETLVFEERHDAKAPPEILHRIPGAVRELHLSEDGRVLTISRGLHGIEQLEVLPGPPTPVATVKPSFSVDLCATTPDGRFVLATDHRPGPPSLAVLFGRITRGRALWLRARGRLMSSLPSPGHS